MYNISCDLGRILAPVSSIAFGGANVRLVLLQTQPETGDTGTLGALRRIQTI